MKRKSKAVVVGDVQIGGGAPVVVQSMTKTDTENVDETVAQIDKMIEAGCEVVRIAVPNDEAAEAMKEIRKRVTIPDRRGHTFSLQTGAQGSRRRHRQASD